VTQEVCREIWWRTFSENIHLEDLEKKVMDIVKMDIREMGWCRVAQSV
jgi:hypothetical protein